MNWWALSQKWAEGKAATWVMARSAPLPAMGYIRTSGTIAHSIWFRGQKTKCSYRSPTVRNISLKKSMRMIIQFLILAPGKMELKLMTLKRFQRSSSLRPPRKESYRKFKSISRLEAIKILFRASAYSLRMLKICLQEVIVVNLQMSPSLIWPLWLLSYSKKPWITQEVRGPPWIFSRPQLLTQSSKKAGLCNQR